MTVVRTCDGLMHLKSVHVIRKDHVIGKMSFHGYAEESTDYESRRCATRFTWRRSQFGWAFLEL
jgi:hypothetical protein